MLTYFVYEMRLKVEIFLLQIIKIYAEHLSVVSNIYKYYDFSALFLLNKCMWKYLIMNIINFNWSKMNSNLSSFFV